MSNLLKSKFLLGVLVVAVLVVGFAVSAKPVAADCTITSTLRVGSVGIEVQCLQGIVGATADGKFGPMTKASVMAWQAGHGLVADGVVGPLTRAALMGAPTGNFPAGCTSAAGYSTTTGVKCDTGTSAGLPAGCSSTAGYSPLTGKKCDSSTGTSSGPLSGGAGSITLTAKSTYSNEEVVAGDEEVPVLAFEVEADDNSDVEITSAKVEFYNSNTASSRRLQDYADKVSILMNGKVVGEADASDFSESSKFYSKTINLDNAIVKAGEKEDFAVAVTALSNLDSGDIDTDSWNVDLINVRFMDAEGVVTTESADAAGANDAGTFDRDLDFNDLATSGDLELKATLGSNSPKAQSVEVDTTNTTDITMLEFKLKAEGSDMAVDAIELTGAVTGTTDNTWADMVSSLALEADGNEIDSVSAYGDAVDDTAGDIWFTDLGLTIDKGDTVTFKVVAKIRPIAGDFDEGDSFTVSLPAASLDDTTNTDVQDGNGDTVVAGDRSGSAVGQAQTFYSTGVAVDMGSATYESVTDSGNVTQVTYTIPLTITSFGDTRYIGLSVEEDDDGVTITDGKAISYAFQDADAPATDLAEATTTAVEAWSCDATIESSTGYRLDEGEAVKCTLTVTLSAENNTPGSYRVHVEGIETWTAAALNAGGVSQLLTPVEDFETSFKLLSS